MNAYLEDVKKQFNYYKTLGEKAMLQVTDDDLFWCYNEESNSIAIIVQHMVGNMLSRWTDFLTTDGEKPWRDRDQEFEEVIKTRQELIGKWNMGWDCLFNALNTINENNWNSTVNIRNEPHTITEAINRQLAHYPYHIGQIVFISKMTASKWGALTIPKGNSAVFNAEKFNK